MRETNLLGRYHDWSTIERALLFSLKRLGKEELGDDALLAAQQIAAAAARLSVTTLIFVNNSATGRAY